jgi:hypothetical protein
MTSSFVSEPPSNVSCLAKPSGNPKSASRNLGLKAKVLWRELPRFYTVHFNGLLLLARWRSLSHRRTLVQGGA